MFKNIWDQYIFSVFLLKSFVCSLLENKLEKKEF